MRLGLARFIDEKLYRAALSTKVLGTKNALTVLHSQ